MDLIQRSTAVASRSSGLFHRMSDALQKESGARDSSEQQLKPHQKAADKEAQQRVLAAQHQLKHIFDGSLVRAWRYFDDRGVGQVEKDKFVLTCQSLRIVGDMKNLTDAYFRGRDYCTLEDFDKRSAEDVFDFRDRCVRACGSLGCALKLFGTHGELSKNQLETALLAVGCKTSVFCTFRALCSDSERMTAHDFLWVEYQHAACCALEWEEPVALCDITSSDAFVKLWEKSVQNLSLQQFLKSMRGIPWRMTPSNAVFERCKSHIRRRKYGMVLRNGNNVKLDALHDFFVAQRACCVFRLLLGAASHRSFVYGWRRLEKRNPYMMHRNEFRVLLRRNGLRLSVDKLWTHLCKDQDTMHFSEIAPVETEELNRLYKDLRSVGTMHEVFLHMSNATPYVSSRMLTNFLRRNCPWQDTYQNYFYLNRTVGGITLDDLLWLEGLHVVTEEFPQEELLQITSRNVGLDLMEGYFALEKQPRFDQDQKSQVCIELLENMSSLDEELLGDEIIDAEHLAWLREVYLVILFLVLCKPVRGPRRQASGSIEFTAAPIRGRALSDPTEERSASHLN